MRSWRTGALLLASASLVGWAGSALSGCSGSGSSGSAPAPFTIELTPPPIEATEGALFAPITVRYPGGAPTSSSWRQLAGPQVPLLWKGGTPPMPLMGDDAAVFLSGLRIAADVELVFEHAAERDGAAATATVTIVVRAADVERALGENVQIGGAVTAVTRFSHDGAEWALFNAGNRLTATIIAPTASATHSVHVEGYIHDIDVVESGGQRLALLACDTKGIAVVDMTDPTAPLHLTTVPVNYFRDGITWTESGGGILNDIVLQTKTAPIAALETDGTTLWIADAHFGIHKTALSNLIDPSGPALEADGTLLIDAERFTVQFAREEEVWGGAQSLRLFGGKLFVAMDYLGLGIFDPDTLEQVGRYNHYTTAGVTEDYFLDRDPAAEVATDPVTGEPFVDAFTGMPDYRQASFEILEVAHGGSQSPTPWADFAVEGKHFYCALDMDVAVSATTGKTVAYVALGLGGLIAVDVTGFETATAGAGFLTGTFLGYLPAMPAHEPETTKGSDSSDLSSPSSLFRQEGAGSLGEPGVRQVVVRGTRVYSMDHLGGLVIAEGADDPATLWRGPNPPYDNDTNGILGDHVPSSEFVTSFDMERVDASDNESLPRWAYESPCLLATSEPLTGHGNAIELMDVIEPATAGNVDLLQCTKSLGILFIDLVDLGAPDVADRFDILAAHHSTDEIGAAPDESPTQPIDLSEVKGIVASQDYVYLAAGSAGSSAWRITDAAGFPTDEVHIAGNSIQDKTPRDLGGVTVYPTQHALGVTLSADREELFVSASTLGLRRVPVGAVEIGAMPGQPLLFKPLAADLFEHKTESGSAGGLNGQDHAYACELDGDLAWVADGTNGLTVYDLTRDPSDPGSGFVAANVAARGQGPLGRTTGVKRWDDPATGRKYAFTASGPKGIGILDVTRLDDIEVVKVFQPIKVEIDDGVEKVGHADGYCTDLLLVGDHAYIAYDAFGVVCYRIADLVAPVPPGVDPTELWLRQGDTLLFDHRPVAVSVFNIEDLAGFDDDFEIHSQSLGLAATQVGGKLDLYVASGRLGLARVAWTDPAAPALTWLVPTVGECVAVTISGGRIFVADTSGGFAIFD